MTQYLTFNLDEEIFALEISRIHEVLEFTSVTPVPRTPSFMRGVINLRGNVVPVVDLKRQFGMAETEMSVSACVIIIEMKVDGEQTILGALADSVQEVMDLEPEQIGPPPKIGSRLKTEFIRGMGRHDEKFIIILDIDRIFSDEELIAVSASTPSGI